MIYYRIHRALTSLLKTVALEALQTQSLSSNAAALSSITQFVELDVPDCDINARSGDAHTPERDGQWVPSLARSPPHPQNIPVGIRRLQELPHLAVDRRI